MQAAPICFFSVICFSSSQVSPTQPGVAPGALETLMVWEEAVLSPFTVWPFGMGAAGGLRVALSPASTHQLTLRLFSSSFLAWEEVFFNPLLEKGLARCIVDSKQELPPLR